MIVECGHIKAGTATRQVEFLTGPFAMHKLIHGVLFECLMERAPRRLRACSVRCLGALVMACYDDTEEDFKDDHQPAIRKLLE